MPSGVAQGEIINVSASLGGRPAKTVQVQSLYGDTTIRFNVSEDILGRHNFTNNPQISPVGFYTKPMLIDTIENQKDDITVPSGFVMTYTNEIPISDIKIVAISSGNKIYFS